MSNLFLTKYRENFVYVYSTSVKKSFVANFLDCNVQTVLQTVFTHQEGSHVTFKNGEYPVSKTAPFIPIPKAERSG